MQKDQILKLYHQVQLKSTQQNKVEDLPNI